MSARTDFPFYNGQPVDIGPTGWLVLIISVVLSFGLLIALPFPDFPLNFIPVLAFTCIPLATLAIVSGGHQSALFGRFGFKELVLAIGFELLTILVSLVTALILVRLVPMSANPVAAGLRDSNAIDMVVFLARTGVQLVGEELLTILPLLAILWLCVRKLKLSRRTGIVLAVIVSTTLFAAAHLPTYNWNFVQCFGGIGVARLVLTAAFLVSRNIWVSAGAHIVNDWTEFLLAPLAVASHGPIDPT